MDIINVKNESQLSNCIDVLNSHTTLGLDLEFDKNLHRYGFNICLIQIQAGDTTFLIDPLSKEMDYKKVFPILENPNIEKIVFAFGEDLRLLNSLSCYPKNIYDLNNATRLLNFEPGSLSRYLNEILRLEVTKSAQRSNWFTRPLKETQIKYAAEDVQYLVALKEVLTLKAKKISVVNWIAEENKVFDNTRYDIDYDTAYIKSKDKKGLTEYQWELLKNLLGYREQLAKKINKPSYMVMGNDFLKDLVHNTDKITNWDMNHGVIRSFRNEKIKLKLVEILDKTDQEALENNLSKTKWANKKNHNDQDRKAHILLKQKLEDLKKNVFKPIQNLIKRDYGEHTATFILSNKIMQGIVMDKDTSGIEKLLKYKIELIHKYADELEIDLSTIAQN